MRVAVLTTSYPRDDDDFAGRFIADAVERLRVRGIDVDVVGPGRYRDFGLAYGQGMVAAVRRRPFLLPPLLVSMARATRRAAAEADLVHAHWLQAGAVALLSGKPFVVTLHGTDVELAKRLPRLARRVLARARAVICVSSFLAEEARRLGAVDPLVIPNGIELPDVTGEEADPLEVLYAGRLSPEKGVEDLLAASSGLNLVVVGDGPLRPSVPGVLGFVPARDLRRLLSRAAVVVCPSRREGFGVGCAEAMAHAKPVVATSVGGLRDLVLDGRTGLVVPPGDPAALRAAIDRLLGNAALRRTLGSAAREHVAALCDWTAVTDATVAVYEGAAKAPEPIRGGRPRM